MTNLEGFRVAEGTAIAALNEPILFGPSSCHGGRRIFVTRSKLYVISKDDASNDCVLEAECIIMHALDNCTVFLQADDDVELTIEFDNNPTLASELSDALTALIELHPIDPHEDMEGAFFDGPVVAGSDDLVVAAVASDEPPLPSEEERQAMLDRLDNLLEVPAELELQPDDDTNDDDIEREGQFDDTTE